MSLAMDQQIIVEHTTMAWTMKAQEPSYLWHGVLGWAWPDYEYCRALGTLKAAIRVMPYHVRELLQDAAALLMDCYIEGALCTRVS